jgi:hypothetical protein
MRQREELEAELEEATQLEARSEWCCETKIKYNCNHNGKSINPNALTE